jgi:hypothetical protein
LNRCPNPCIHLPSALITNIAPTSSKKTAKVCFHCGQSGHFSLQCPDRRQRQTLPDKKCYNCEEKGYIAITCTNPHSRPPLPLSTNAAPNHKGGSTSVKATTSCFNYGQVGQFTNRCPDQRHLSTPTQSNQNMAQTPTYRKCYNYRQKGHFANVYPNP